MNNLQFNKIFNKWFSDRLYLQRGHLAARAHFFYTSQQMGTFYFLNVIPQWSTINMGNWANIERKIRLYSKTNNRPVQLYVGSFGTLELKSAREVKREIYLQDTKEMRTVPVPKIMFSLVYDAFQKSAIIIVTINNPYIDYLDEDYYLCNDICDKVGFNFRNRRHFDKGYSYCCSYDSMKNIIPYLPKLEVHNLISFNRNER